MSLRPFPLPVRIAGTSSFAPGPTVTTAELVRRVSPPRDAAAVEARSGVATRSFAPRDVTHAELAAAALTEALAVAALPATALDRLIFVCSFGGDMAVPATANHVAARLGLAGSCDCFDVNNACMGFLTAFDVAARSIATGSGPVGIAAVELISRFTTPDDPRPFLVLADGVAAAVLVPSRADGGVLGTWLRNDGIAFGNVRLDHPHVTGKPESVRFTASNDQMTGEAIDAVTRATAAALAQAGIGLGDVEWILPHQPNGALLGLIVDALGVAPDRVVPVVHEVGSVGAASIPISLDRLLRSGRARAGERVLMVGVGGGLASGAVVLRLE